MNGTAGTITILGHLRAVKRLSLAPTCLGEQSSPNLFALSCTWQDPSSLGSSSHIAYDGNGAVVMDLYYYYIGGFPLGKTLPDRARGSTETFRKRPSGKKRNDFSSGNSGLAASCP